MKRGVKQTLHRMTQQARGLLHLAPFPFSLGLARGRRGRQSRLGLRRSELGSADSELLLELFLAN